MYLTVNDYGFNSIFTLITINIEAIKLLNDENYLLHLEGKIHSTTEDLLEFVKTNDQHSFRRYIFALIGTLSEKAKTTRYNQDILDLIKDLTDLCKFNDDLRNVFYDSNLILLADFRGSDYDTYDSRKKSEPVAFKINNKYYTSEGVLLGDSKCYCCNSFDCQRNNNTVVNQELDETDKKSTDADDFDFTELEDFDFDDDEEPKPLPVTAGEKVIKREALREGESEVGKRISNSYVIDSRTLDKRTIDKPWYSVFLPFTRK